MSDLISRQATIDICNGAIDLWHGQLGEGALVAVKEGLEGLPPAEPERKKGEWIEIKHTFFHKCSECNWLNYIDSGFNFCPNCGSYNGGERDG